jgi:DNA end-binding protein Ku
MKWPDEVRSPHELAPRSVEVGEAEIEQTLLLADRMAIENLAGFHDKYRQALEDIIAAKSEGKPLPSPAEGEEKEKGEVVDLMAALTASVKAAKDSRGEDQDREDATVHEMHPSRTGGGTEAAKKKTASSKTASGQSSARHVSVRDRAPVAVRSAGQAVGGIRR